MKLSTLIAAVLALAMLVTYLVASSLGLVSSGSSAAPKSMVMAAATIGAGQRIEASQIKLVPWSNNLAPEGVIESSAAAVGRVARQTIYAGEYLIEPKLAPTTARGGLSSTIETGKRAISVRVNEVVGVAGFALPGSYVDVLVSAKDQANQPFSTTVLSRIKVLAAAQETQSSQADQTRPKTVNAVTLELTPGEAEKLDLARSIGSLSLVLRNDSDTGDAETGGTRLNHILRGEVAAAPAGPTASAPARPRVNSTQRSEVHGAITSIRGITRREELP